MFSDVTEMPSYKFLICNLISFAFVNAIYCSKPTFMHFTPSKFVFCSPPLTINRNKKKNYF